MNSAKLVFRNLDSFIDYSVALTKGHGRDPNRFVNMQRELGTHKAVSVLVMSGIKDDGSFSDGFEWALDEGLAEYTLEQGAIDFAHEFPAKERKHLVEMAKWKLEVGMKDSAKRRALEAAKLKRQQPYYTKVRSLGQRKPVDGLSTV
jgi:hypothetical protein